MDENKSRNLATVTIKSIDLEGRGISHIDGKTVFVDGALADEIVAIEIYKRKPNFDKARVVEIIQKSANRVVPACVNFGICGGCSLQHLEFSAQVSSKQQVLLDNLKHIGQVTPLATIPPLIGKPFAYRHRARLSVRYVAKKGGVLVGFHEKASSFVADMNQCLILPQVISDLIPILKETIGKLSIYNKIPQIEIAVGDVVYALVFRIMQPLTLADELVLRDLVDQYSTVEQIPLQIWLQPDKPESCYPFYPLNMPQLSYTIPQFNLEMPFFPTEFTQVNPLINQQMVTLALSYLDPLEHETIADFFCGIGNFTLPIAKLAKTAIGIEGSHQLVTRAQENAKHNQLENKTEYKVANLFKVDSNWLYSLGQIDKWLIDPPRDGAMELIKAITADIAPQRIVYISCNPATLARDAGTLVNSHGYSLVATGVMNMFPHTSHIESIAIFELNKY